jgi:hypothetical protein
VWSALPDHGSRYSGLTVTRPLADRKRRAVCGLSVKVAAGNLR